MSGIGSTAMDRITCGSMNSGGALRWAHRTPQLSSSSADWATDASVVGRPVLLSVARRSQSNCKPTEADLPWGEFPLETVDAECIDLSDNFESGLRKLCTALTRVGQENLPPVTNNTSSITTEPVVINTPPLCVPAHFLGRNKQSQDIEDFIRNEDSGLLWIWGRAGSGKTGLACHVLDHIQRGVWASSKRAVPIHAIGYFNWKHHPEVAWSNVLNEIRNTLLPESSRHRQERHLASAVNEIVSSLSDRRVVLLLDDLDDLIDPNTKNLTDLHLCGMLEAVLTDTRQRLKVIAISRILPLNLTLTEQARCLTCNLATGLSQSEATQLLRVLDHDGAVGFRDGNDLLLVEMFRRTQGNPGAIKALYELLTDNRNTSIKSILGMI